MTRRQALFALPALAIGSTVARHVAEPMGRTVVLAHDTVQNMVYNNVIVQMGDAVTMANCHFRDCTIHIHGSECVITGCVIERSWLRSLLDFSSPRCSSNAAVRIRGRA